MMCCHNSFALFRSLYVDNVPRSKGLLADSLDGIDRELLYPTIRKLLANDDGLTGYAMQTIFKTLSKEELKVLLPEIVKVANYTPPSGEMFAQEIRGAAFQFLAKNQFDEGLPAFIEYFATQNGWGCKTIQLLPLLQQYGAAASSILPQLRQLQAAWRARESANHESGNTRSKVAAEVIRSIETAN